MRNEVPRKICVYPQSSEETESFHNPKVVQRLSTVCLQSFLNFILKSFFPLVPLACIYIFKIFKIEKAVLFVFKNRDEIVFMYVLFITMDR